MVGTMNAVQVQLLGTARATRDAGEVAFVPDMRYRSLAYLAYRGDYARAIEVYEEIDEATVARLAERAVELLLRGDEAAGDEP